MKNLLIIIILVLMVITSCKKEVEVSVDVNGIWYGTYAHDDVSGTFITRITQNSAQCKGDLFIRYDPPSEESYNTDVFGLLNGNKFKSDVTIVPVQIKVESQQLTNTNGKGIFSTNIGISGSWIGQKIAMGTTNINSIPLNEPANFSIVGCASFKNTLLVYSYIDQSFHQIDSTGQEIGKFLYKNSVSEVTTDGEYIWVYNTSDGFKKIDSNGSVITSVKLPVSYYTSVIAHNGALFCYDTFKKLIYKYNYLGQKTDSIAMPFYLSDMEYGEGHFYLTDSNLKVVLQTDDNFNFLNAFALPDNGYSEGNAFFKGSIWYFLNEYQGQGSLKLYKIKLQD